MGSYLLSIPLVRKLCLIVVCFSLFSIASFYLYREGYVSCGCAGVINFDPVYVGIFDLLIVTGL